MTENKDWREMAAERYDVFGVSEGEARSIEKDGVRVAAYESCIRGIDAMLKSGGRQSHGRFEGLLPSQIARLKIQRAILIPHLKEGIRLVSNLVPRGRR